MRFSRVGTNSCQEEGKIRIERECGYIYLSRRNKFNCFTGTLITVSIVPPLTVITRYVNLAWCNSWHYTHPWIIKQIICTDKTLSLGTWVQYPKRKENTEYSSHDVHIQTSTQESLIGKKGGESLYQYPTDWLYLWNRKDEMFYYVIYPVCCITCISEMPNETDCPGVHYKYSIGYFNILLPA